MAGSLWTPQGEQLIEKDVAPVTREEIIILSKMHDIAVKHKLVLVCKLCDHGMVGNNNDAQTTLSISCKCRELRYVHGA